jgi:His/Glu/Gln/Arg/opine family amino acid ABC transporter permease subunit
MTFDLSIFLTYWPIVLRGLLLTIVISACGLALALLLGVAVAFARLSRRRAVAYLAMIFVEIVRDLPFMVILFLIFYLLPSFGVRLPALAVGIITLGLYGSAYYAEIIRGAILSVPKGQMESARAQGMSRLQAFRHVIAPQMMGYFLPPATNQAVMVVKDSSVLSTITVIELTMSGQILQGYTYSPIEVFLGISVLYWILCAGVSRLGLWLEAALQPSRRQYPSIGKAGAAAQGATQRR